MTTDSSLVYSHAGGSTLRPGAQSPKCCQPPQLLTVDLMLTFTLYSFNDTIQTRGLQSPQNNFVETPCRMHVVVNEGCHLYCAARGVS